MNLHKIVPYFIALVFVFIVCSWIFMGVIAYKGATSINENGVKGVVEQLWCGKQPDCKLPLEPKPTE